VTCTVKGTAENAKKELRQRLRAIDLGEHVDPSRMTVGAWLTRWLDIVTPEVSPKTIERYSGIVRNTLIPALGSSLIAKLTPADIQRAYSELATGGRRDGKEGGLSARTRRHCHRVLHAALGRAVELQVLARNPATFRKGRLPKVERKEMVTLTAEQGQRFLAFISHSRVYWPVLIALATGMRRGEILALRWKSVDLLSNSGPSLRVVQSLEETKTGLRFKPPKNNKHRTITLPAFAVEALRRQKREQAEELLQLGVRQNGDTLVCGRADGEPKSPISLSQEFMRLVGRAKDIIPRVRFHDLRHSHATELLRSGVHVKIVSERLGHSSVAITLDLYSHVDAAMQADAAARLDAAFSLAKPAPGGQK
jgi:integrase